MSAGRRASHSNSKGSRFGTLRTITNTPMLGSVSRLPLPNMRPLHANIVAIVAATPAASASSSSSSSSAFLFSVFTPTASTPFHRPILHLQRQIHVSPILGRKRKQWKSAEKYMRQRDLYATRIDRDADTTDDDDFFLHSVDREKGMNGAKAEAQWNYEPSDEVVQCNTLGWIRDIVIGLNLCPFAAHSLASDKLSVLVARGDDDESVIASVLLELILRVETPGTTVVVAPECHPDNFLEYLEVANCIESLMDEHDLTGDVQLATFHPSFEFGGSGPDGVDNYTNRSPYPMFHILREEEVGAAVDKLNGDAGKVWRRNVTLMELMEDRLGRQGVADVMACNPEGKKDAMEQILRDIKEVENY